MTNASAREIVESYRTTLGKGDFASARNLMQDNMDFEGPLDTFDKADDYLAANKRLSSIIQRVDLKKRSEEHTSELQSRPHLVCRLLLEKKTTHKNSFRRRSSSVNV